MPWKRSLALIRENVSEQQFRTWFAPIVFENYNEESKTIVLRVPSPFVYEYIEENYVDLLTKVLNRTFCNGVKLAYRVVTDQEHKLSQVIEAEGSPKVASQGAHTMSNQAPTALDAATPQELDPQLNPRQTFSNFVEGSSNKLPRAVGLSIAEHPNGSQFNPMFLYGPSGCGKTHLINAIGLKTREMYPQKRVLYVSARLFQVQYTDSVRQNSTNDFIRFYQTIDLLIVDDIQEWIGSEKTQQTFFHIFDHLFRNGKRIIMASDRPPVDLKGMPDRLLTRFSCGLIAELEKPNRQLCIDILKNKVRRDGLQIPTDVIEYVADTSCGSVRELEGVINSLMAYSVVYNCDVDMNLAEKVIKQTSRSEESTLSVDDIIDTVSQHFDVSADIIQGKSRKRNHVDARQVCMYIAQKYTKMPANRIGKLIGGRDHSTVLHSCSAIEQRLKSDQELCNELEMIENDLRIKR